MASRRKTGRRRNAYVAHTDDFINSSGDGFVDGAAEHLTDINPQMKDALSTIMLQVADILRDLRKAEETKNTDLAKILRGNLAYILNAAMVGGLKTTEKASGTAQFVYEPGGTLNGYRAINSNQVESGDLYFGNFQIVLTPVSERVDD